MFAIWNVSQSESIVALVAIAVLAFAFSAFSHYFRRHRYPPGPPAFPIIGNILEVSPQGALSKLTEYQNKYGMLLLLHFLFLPDVCVLQVT